MEKWLEKMIDPPAEYRPHPFWSWNDDLEEGELRRQIREMKKTGHGGFFMHARDGLITPYMGEKWFKLINACSDEAEKCGIEAWCYDEKGWPSGSAGHEVPNLGDYYRVRWLKLLPLGEGENTQGEVIAYYGVKADNSYRILSRSRGEAEEALGEDEKMMYATQFTGGDYIDILNPDVVRKFIDVTYERYAKESEDEFKRGTLHGFFTDEPQYSLCKTPYSTITEAEFMKEYNYSIVDNIPALFLGRDGMEAVRYDYWKLVSRLFTESFAKQIYEWCDAHNCSFTGHAMMEDNMLCQIHCTGGCMPMYEYMHIPGIDWLGRGVGRDRVKPDHVESVTPLQLGSVAAQLGKHHVISEMFALAGWDVSFRELRFIAEWQFLGGVNMICQHLEGYTLRGMRKGDYPPGMFYQSPWWNEYKNFNDTLSRLGMLLANGESDPGILLLHPMHSVWLKYTNDNLNAEQEYDDTFNLANYTLDELHLVYHLGDETIMARHGRVENGRLIIGKCSYHTVFIPSIFGLDRSTVELFKKFEEEGGRIISLGEKPEFISGRRCPEELAELTSKWIDLPLEGEELKQYITINGLKKVTVSGPDGEDPKIHVTVRDYPGENRRVYMFLNTDIEKKRRVRIDLPEAEAVEFMPEDMSFRSHPVISRKNGISLDVWFCPMESHTFIAGEGLPEAEPVLSSCESAPLKLQNEWTISEKSSPNSYLMEFCRVGDGKEWGELKHTYLASKECESDKWRRVEPQVRFTFDIEDKADLDAMKDMRLVSEFRQPADIYVNGRKAELIPGEWFVDHTFSVYGIGGLVKHGENEIIVKGFCKTSVEDGVTVYRHVNEFGYMYLFGNFGVFPDKPYTYSENHSMVTYGKLSLGDKVTKLEGGNITAQGWPFFAGTVVLEQEIEIKDASIRRHIDLGSPYAACARVIVNGERGRLMAWGDFTEDVTGRLHEGKNKIEIELTTGNRNLLGPHHMENPEPQCVGPSEFIPFEPKKWLPRFSFVKAGLGE
ncbi:MAG: hypothetical protein PUE85_07230 [Firmicutes bacterium]|nr:hypothetical protein [Bacillota bacterium]